MKIAPLFEAQAEPTDAAASKCAIVLTTRVRLARNLSGQPFPGWAKEAQRSAMLSESTCAMLNKGCGADSLGRYYPS